MKPPKQRLAQLAQNMLERDATLAWQSAKIIGRIAMTLGKTSRIIRSIMGLALAGLSLPALAIDAPAVIPEPGTMALVLGGVGAGILVWRNRRK